MVANHCIDKGVRCASCAHNGTLSKAEIDMSYKNTEIECLGGMLPP